MEQSFFRISRSGENHEALSFWSGFGRPFRGTRTLWHRVEVPPLPK
jgi:hypothetical protein